MTTLVREHFARHGLVEGRDLLLGNSPNRVMPGRLVERVRSSDKLVAGLHPATPVLIERLYRRVVTRGTLYQTNSMTAEVVKTLENAYRDVRIAYAAEIARECDARGVDFFALREAVNTRVRQGDAATADPTAVPSGGLLVPTTGVGGHCLPKDGILLWWRRLERGEDQSRSLILGARIIDDASPAEMVRLIERTGGPVTGRRLALLGTAYRFNSEDTRNSPTLVLARLLLERGAVVRLHDPYVRPDDQYLRKFELTAHFTRDLAAAVADADTLVMCTAHCEYVGALGALLAAAPRATTVIDGMQSLSRPDSQAGASPMPASGAAPLPHWPAMSRAPSRWVPRGRAGGRQRSARSHPVPERAVRDRPIQHDRLRRGPRLAGTCVTGCAIAELEPATPVRDGIASRSDLVRRAVGR